MDDVSCKKIRCPITKSQIKTPVPLVKVVSRLIANAEIRAQASLYIASIKASRASGMLGKAASDAVIQNIPVQL